MKVCCATGRSKMTKQQYDKVGLIHHHAYSVVGIYEIENQFIQPKQDA
jgi:hypothetical protein